MNTENDAIARLHDHYVEAVNLAVAEDDLARVDQLTAEYDRESALMRATLRTAA